MVSTRKIEVWVPHRISGFFQMMDPKEKNSQKDLTKIGSRGGGPSLTAFGKTKITILGNDLIENKVNRENRENRENKVNLKIFINGKETTLKAKTSASVVDQMAHYLPKNANLRIEHNFDLPIGAGFGSSGAGALGIALGLNSLFNLKLSPLEAAKFAHIAEVEQHTGLGTVGGQFIGGLSIITVPGYPFRYQKIPVPENIEIVLGSWGSINTKDILINPEYKKLIHKVGGEAMKKITDRFTLQNYMNVCKFFIEKTDLLTRLNLPLLKDLIKSLYELNIIGASMNQLGKSVFCICDKTVTNQVIRVFKQFNPKYGIKIVKVCNHGPEIKNLV